MEPPEVPNIRYREYNNATGPKYALQFCNQLDGNYFQSCLYEAAASLSQLDEMAKATADMIKLNEGIESKQKQFWMNMLQEQKLETENKILADAMDACDDFIHEEHTMNISPFGKLSMPRNFHLKASIASTVRIRGGGDPIFRKDDFSVPALDKINFKWNGLPMVDFMQKVVWPLKVAGRKLVEL